MKYTHIGIDDQATAVSKLPWQREGNGDANAEASDGEDDAGQRSASATRRPNGHPVSPAGIETTSKPENPKNKTPCEQGVYDASRRSMASSGIEDASVEAAGIEPASPNSQPFYTKQLSDSQSGSAAVWQRNNGSKCHDLTPTGNETSDSFAPSIAYIRRAWPNLPPHVREAIFTLIDGSLALGAKEDRDA